jgi:hypothetical protein
LIDTRATGWITQLLRSLDKFEDSFKYKCPAKLFVIYSIKISSNIARINYKDTALPIGG